MLFITSLVKFVYAKCHQLRDPPLGRKERHNALLMHMLTCSDFLCQLIAMKGIYCCQTNHNEGLVASNPCSMS